MAPSTLDAASILTGYDALSISVVPGDSPDQALCCGEPPETYSHPGASSNSFCNSLLEQYINHDKIMYTNKAEVPSGSSGDQLKSSSFCDAKLIQQLLLGETLKFIFHAPGCIVKVWVTK
jgi:hypothetical protein